MIERAAQGEPRPAPITGPGRKEDCTNKDIDVNKVAQLAACTVPWSAAARNLPAGISLGVDKASLAVARGGSVDVPIVLDNTTDRALSVDVDAKCGL